MRYQDVRSPWLAAWMLWLVISPHVTAQTAQVAVVGDPSLSNLIDVTTAQLSTEPGLSVLERADLDKLGQEKALQSMLGSNDFSQMRLFPATGLVLLRAVKHDDKVGIFARLVAVQPGVVLREVALPDSADPQAQAEALVEEFAPYWSKLTAIQKGKITALSLLGLRFEVDAPETREMERSINVLLASRLSAEPDTLVLERWRLNDAVFEKSLSAQTVPFWTGSSLIDGSMTWEKGNNQVKVNLRMRPPQGAEVSISDQATADHLPALVGRLADKIQHHPMSAQIAWQPATEAGHYAELGQWCLDNRLFDEGAEAIESALALGDTSRTTRMLQIRAYALLAYPDDLRDAAGYGIGFDSFTWDTLAGHLGSAILAADLTCGYLKTNHDFSDPSGTLEDPVALSVPVLNNCLRTLRIMYDKGYQRYYGDDVAHLRQSVRTLMAQMEQLLGERHSDRESDFLRYQIDYAGFWHESPAETLAYYRDLLNRKTDGAVIRQTLFEPGYPILHSPYLDADRDLEGTPVWFLGSPWIIAWDNRPQAELKTLWQNFIKELSASPDPIAQGDALKFERDSVQTNELRNSVGEQIIALLQEHPESIRGPRGEEFVAGLSATFRWAAQPENATYRDDLLKLFETLFEQRAILPSSWIRNFSFCFTYRNPSNEAQRYSSILRDYGEWYRTQVPQDPKVVAEIAMTQKAFYDAKAEAAVKTASGGFLPVHHHWPSQAGIEDSSGPGGGMAPQLDSRSLMTAENKVWFVPFNLRQGTPKVLGVDPATLQTVSSYDIPDQLIQSKPGDLYSCSLAVSPQWLALENNGHVYLCSRITNQWTTLDLPLSRYKPCWIGQELYLIYDAVQFIQDGISASSSGPAISGLIHVSLPEGKIENLVSSRRIPPQSALDGKDLGYPIDLWSSPDGLLFAVNADSPHFQVFASPVGKNDWSLVASNPMGADIKLGAGGALIGRNFDDHGFAQVVLMNGATTQVLLSNPNRVKPEDAGSPRWDFPEDIQAAPVGEIWQASAVMRGDDLCLYRNVMNGTGDGTQAALYYFAKGQKCGTKIPLAFSTSGMTNPALIRIQSAIFNYQAVMATDYGLIIGQVMRGFWVIPWSDIDAYRANSSGGTPPTVAPISSDFPVTPVAIPENSPGPVSSVVPVTPIPNAQPPKLNPVAPTTPAAVTPTESD